MEPSSNRRDGDDGAAPPRPRRLHVAPGPLQGVVVGIGFGAAAAGLLGADGGILWLIGGVWLVRLMWGRPPYVAWGIACVMAGIRWGTLSLADVEAATRTLGPSVAVEPAVVAAGLALAMFAAAAELAREPLEGLAGPERGVLAVAIVALVAALGTRGPGAPDMLRSVLWWGASSALIAVVLARVWSVARRIPSWLPSALAGTGGLLVVVGRL